MEILPVSSSNSTAVGEIVSLNFIESIKEARSRVQDLTSGEIVSLNFIESIKEARSRVQDLTSGEIVVRLGINPMIQPEPEDLPKDNPKLEIAVLRFIKRRTSKELELQSNQVRVFKPIVPAERGSTSKFTPMKRTRHHIVKNKRLRRAVSITRLKVPLSNFHLLLLFLRGLCAVLAVYRWLRGLFMSFHLLHDLTAWVPHPAVIIIFLLCFRAVDWEVSWHVSSSYRNHAQNIRKMVGAWICRGPNYDRCSVVIGEIAVIGVKAAGQKLWKT
ncbi:hypothetical protein Tco_1556096 [Tanacetum coccineum]